MHHTSRPVTSASKRNAPMKKDLPAIDDIRKVLSYDAGTGKFKWLVMPLEFSKSHAHNRSWNAQWSGKEALTSTNTNGYKKGSVLGVFVSAHRVAWALHYGKWPDGHIDHINGDRADNRIENLRDVLHHDNMRNMAATRLNTSGQVGVRWNKKDKRWHARIGGGGGKSFKHIGVYKTFDEAVAARKQAEIEMGYHPNHGRTTCPTAKGYTR